MYWRVSFLWLILKLLNNRALANTLNWYWLNRNKCVAFSSPDSDEGLINPDDSPNLKWSRFIYQQKMLWWTIQHPSLLHRSNSPILFTEILLFSLSHDDVQIILTPRLVWLMKTFHPSTTMMVRQGWLGNEIQTNDFSWECRDRQRPRNREICSVIFSSSSLD